MHLLRPTHASRSVSMLGILTIAILAVGIVLIYRIVTRPLEERLSAPHPELASPESALHRYLLIREELNRGVGSIEELLRSMSRDDIKWFRANYQYISYFSLGGKTTGISQVLSDIERRREAMKQVIREGPRGDATKILSLTEKRGRAIAIAQDLVTADVAVAYPIFLVKEERNWKIRDFFGSRQQIWQMRVVEVKRRANEALTFDEMQFEKDGLAHYLHECIEFYEAVGVAPPENLEKEVLSKSRESIAQYKSMMPQPTATPKVSEETRTATPTAAPTIQAPTEQTRAAKPFVPLSPEEKGVVAAFSSYLVKRRDFEQGATRADVILEFMTSKDVAWLMKNFSYLLGDVTQGNAGTERWENMRLVVAALIAQGPGSPENMVRDVKVKGARAVLFAEEKTPDGQSRRYAILYISEQGQWRIKDFFFAREMVWQPRIIRAKQRQNVPLNADEQSFLVGGIERYRKEIEEFFSSVDAAMPQTK